MGIKYHFRAKLENLALELVKSKFAFSWTHNFGMFTPPTLNLPLELSVSVIVGKNEPTELSVSVIIVG